VDFIFLDVETTGLDPKKGDRVCEIALLKVRSGEEIGELVSLVNPSKPIPPDIQEMCGITDEMVASAPLFSEIAGKVSDFLEGGAIVAHNIKFDMEFLAAELAPCRAGALENPQIDTLTLAKNFYRLPSYGLSSVAAALKIPYGTLHRALDDIRLTRDIFYRFLRDFEVIEIRTLGDLLELQKDLEAEWGEKAGVFGKEIEEAIRAGTVIWIKYLTGDGYPSEREVKPLSMETAGRYPVMKAFCFNTREERSFRLDRIIELKKPKNP